VLRGPGPRVQLLPDPRMTALAVTLALAFWAPYHDGPVCPQGVQIQYQHYATAHQAGWSYMGSDDCVIELAYWTRKVPMEQQCAYIAHELGHNVFDLDHSSDPRNIMYYIPPVPRACYRPLGLTR
jgi:hypothetical protein